MDCSSTVEHLRAVTTFAGVHDGIERIEEHADVLYFATYHSQEQMCFSQIVLALQHHSNHLIAAVVKAPPPKTFAELRLRMVPLPYDSPAEGLPPSSFLARVSDGVRPRAVSGAGSQGIPVHTDAYVNRLKRRLQLAQEVAMQRGATKADLTPPPSHSTPVPPSPSPRLPFGRGGGHVGKMPRGKEADKQVTAHVAVAPDSMKVSGTPNEIVEIYNASAGAAKTEDTFSVEKQLTVQSNSWRLEDDPFRWTFADTQTQEASETLSPKHTGIKSESSAMMQPQMLNSVTPVEQEPINEQAQPIEPKVSSTSVISEKTEPSESEPPKLQQM